MYQRFSALQTVAYNMRKNDGVKTRVKIGQSDFELSIREQGSSFWQRCDLPTDLPKIESNSTSPPPGRLGRQFPAPQDQEKDTAEQIETGEENV